MIYLFSSSNKVEAANALVVLFFYFVRTWIYFTTSKIQLCKAVVVLKFVFGCIHSKASTDRNSQPAVQ